MSSGGADCQPGSGGGEGGGGGGKPGDRRQELELEARRLNSK